ncbi:SDR family NAD(P)-dependent oxidoreductase [Hoyosella subflava]|uniref:Putative 3-oxoacyl-acyl carrier protein reductase n=1 Tax=Hoyosella subflava (strain DSM 45089 / JCM 17490 / NBRC 109087 / DQS3-9A1) TaxID=443218 RepID=F6ELD7_HOYSD|nr:SDR family NAD(P)-dependent oxidoreductase [Hoyosella subflava]AEF39229.1 Putative 3-oxoacyl-acyl carrier protein reductase [Hoyosella subflava DQS3-9A1]
MLTTPTLHSSLLTGQTAIVTGGGNGIGRATAEILAANGATVVVADLDADLAEQVAREIGAGASAYGVDLTDPAAADKLIAHVAESGNGIDIIVNGAGYFWDAPVHKMTDEQFQAMLDIHLLAPFRICRAAAPYFRDQGKREAAEGTVRHRKIVNITSLAASFGNPGAANYAAAKAGLIGLTKTLALEWGSANVNVNAVAFGVIQTRFGAPQSEQNTIDVGGRTIPLGVPDKTLQMMGFDPTEQRDLYAPQKIAGSALGRTGTIQEAADTIFWLASPLSNFVTGQVVAVSGGARGGLA